tara:strand:- start:372 stop:1004 length:633 start_codon:yes stop_codon:yes gene_type:complete
MSSRKDGIMIILSSPSGAGKTTLVNKISESEKFIISVSHTTRKPRTNEVNGKDYIFISQEEFEKLISKNEFLEYAKVFDNLYGSSINNVIKNLESGKNVIFDIDWQGTSQIKNKKLNFELITFFILPPSRNELFQRLLNRDMNDKNIALERMKQFDIDVLKWKDYDYTVINDDLENCYEEIINILKTHDLNKKYNFNKQKIEKHIKILLG